MAAVEARTREQRADILAEADRRNEGFYGAGLWRLRHRVEELGAAEAKPGEGPADEPGEGGED